MNTHESESIISLKHAPSTSYATYVQIQESIVNEIQTLREKLSKEKYNVSLDSLTKRQLSVIRKTYPQNWIE
jgi:hypothetical protein